MKYKKTETKKERGEEEGRKREREKEKNRFIGVICEIIFIIACYKSL